jgi:PleD family two-component response regulator
VPRVLIIDDSGAARTRLTQTLKQAGWEVASAAEALYLAKSRGKNRVELG